MLARWLCLDQQTSEEVTPQPNTLKASISKRGCPLTQRCGDNASVFIKISERRLLLSAPSGTNWIQTNLLWNKGARATVAFEETLTDASPVVSQSQSSGRATAKTSSNVHDESIKNQVTDSVANCNYFATTGGGRARPSETHSDVLVSILQHVASARGEQATSRASEMHDYHSSNGGGRGNLRAAHSDVPISIFQHTSIEHDSAHITSPAMQQVILTLTLH